MKIRQFKLGPMDNFSYAVWDEGSGQAALIDPAWEPGVLDAFLKKEGLDLKCLLLTHAHPDHVNGVAFFTGRNKGLPVYLNSEDHFMLEQRPAGLRNAVEGEKIPVGSAELTVMRTAGHTQGSVCYLVPGAVFSGDTLFVGECGRVDLPGSSPEALYNSFVRLAALPDGDALYPGHSYNGDTSTLGVQKEYNLYLKLARQGRREDFLKAIL
ncbi:MAG TPA: MBL fold metallo-hydrolase [Elusimicrobiales bacterium]|nr:MBL fold metallo-hydrolase [Elusimicrobiales bacterium]